MNSRRAIGLVPFALALAACAAAAPSTADPTPAEASSPSASTSSVDVETSRRLLNQHVRLFDDQVGEPRDLIEILENPLNQTTSDDAAVLVEQAEEIVDWIDEERAWLAELPTGPCIEEAVGAYEEAIDALEVVTERLFDSPSDPDAAKVRAAAALDDAESAIRRAREALPDAC